MDRPTGKRVKKQPVTPADLIPALPSAKDICAEVCYYYGYRLEEVESWSFRKVRRLLRTARRLEALKYHNLTQIAAAAQTEKLKGVEILLKHYSEIIDGR